MSGFRASGFQAGRHLLALGALLWLGLIGREFYLLGWGSGHWLGRFSPKWAAALGVYVLLALAAGTILLRGVYRPRHFASWKKRWLQRREALGPARWLFTALLALAPAYFIFFSPWGGLFVSLPTRLMIFALSSLLVAALLTRNEERLIAYQPLLLAGLWIGSLLVLAESFTLVRATPFSLHWSEGNRIWDYSLLFGRQRYNYPPDEDIYALIDRGRQALWGLPFLISDLPIWGVRLWSAFLETVPYALLGWMAFRPSRPARWTWWLLGIWSMLFLNQGPIYTPLIFSAILVAGARRQPLWLALPLVFLAGHYAGISRFTWRFAPAIWALLLTVGDAVLQQGRIRGRDGLRAGLLGIAGLWSKGIPLLVGVLEGLLAAASPNQAAATPPATGPISVETLGGLQAATTTQPFIWYRLLPNEAFAPGILLGAVLATLPLILLLVYVQRQGHWKTTLWQNILMLGALLAFLVVGLIASAKIGGGTDLHNLDMFLVSLVLLAGLAWGGGLPAKLQGLLSDSTYLRGVLLALVFIPALIPAITGLPPEMLDKEQAQWELERIQERIACAAPYGQILLMDQRQLLTFGYLGDLPLVPEYEKKHVMNQALAGNAAFFEQFRADLEAGRFSLILTERQALRYKYLDEDRVGDSLVEENNAWVAWVTEPLLEYYESVANRREAAIQLFVPIEREFDC